MRGNHSAGSILAHIIDLSTAAFLFDTHPLLFTAQIILLPTERHGQEINTQQLLVESGSGDAESQNKHGFNTDHSEKKNTTQ